MDESTLKEILAEIQDYLMPQLDSYEQMLYHYLFRHTHLEKKKEIIIGTRALQTRIGLGIGKAGSPPSQRIVSEKIRSLEKKGCIKVDSRSAQGTRIEVFLPKQIPGIIPETTLERKKKLEDLDFFKTPELRQSILKREKHKCFYCLKSLSDTDFALDHVHPKVLDGNNSYKNIVASCFECNSRKQDREANDFLRENYRNGLITVSV